MSGCAASRYSAAPVPQKKGNVPGYEELEAPISISILSESYRDNQLSVRILLTPEVRLEGRTLKLVLTGLRSGEELNQAFIVPTDDLLAGESYEYPLELKAINLSDYRVDVEWGGKKQIGPLPRLALNKVSAVRSECKENMCRAEFRVAATISNKGPTGENEAVLKNLILATSFKIKGQGTVVDKSAEDLLRLDNINLQPGGSRQLEITIEQEVPRQIVNNLEPDVRISSFN
jgi:hypothetical protein